jgi:hypothetical protein
MQFLRVLKMSLSAVSSYMPCCVSPNIGLARMTEGIGLVMNISHLYLSYTHFESGQVLWFSSTRVGKRHDDTW